MPYVRPSLGQLVSRAETDLSARLLDGDAPLRRSVVGVLARVAAGQAHMLYGYLDWLAGQPFVDTAEAEYLERHARIWDVTRKAAVAAAGTVSLPGANGAVIPAGTELRRADDALYTSTADATVTGGAAAVPVAAQAAGAVGNADAGITLTLTSPVSGVQASGTVAAGGIVGGLDAEDDDSLRARVLRRIQEPPQGGTAADYITWALEVPGVTRAWVYPLHMGGGTVGVAIVNDDADDGPIPGTELVADVQAYLDTMRPVTAEVFAFAPTPLVVNIDLRVTPNTEAVRAAATAELRDLFARESEPGAVLLLSHITEAVSLAPGEVDHVVLAPAADVVPAAYEMPVLGAITFD